MKPFADGGVIEMVQYLTCVCPHFLGKNIKGKGRKGKKKKKVKAVEEQRNSSKQNSFDKSVLKELVRFLAKPPGLRRQADCCKIYYFAFMKPLTSRTLVVTDFCQNNTAGTGSDR